jgi:hypothetical protein
MGLRYPKKDKHGHLVFTDHPEFTPNLSPAEVIRAGAWCGGYFRRVYSTVAKRFLEESDYTKFPFLRKLPKKLMTVDISGKHDHSVNKYGVHASLPLIYWEKSGWIRGDDYRGNFQWYCEFYAGRRRPAIDQYQIKRWNGIAGANSGRFRKNLIRQIYDSGKRFDDVTVSPVIRQSLHHWYYRLTREDYNLGVKELLEKRKRTGKAN